MYSSLSCLGRAVYKQLVLSSADGIYWKHNSGNQTFHRYVVIQVLNYYVFVIISGEFSLLFLPHTIKSLSKNLMQGRVAYILFLKNGSCSRNSYIESWNLFSWTILWGMLDILLHLYKANRRNVDMKQIHLKFWMNIHCVIHPSMAFHTEADLQFG